MSAVALKRYAIELSEFPMSVLERAWSLTVKDHKVPRWPTLGDILGNCQAGDVESSRPSTRRYHEPSLEERPIMRARWPLGGYLADCAWVTDEEIHRYRREADPRELAKQQAPQRMTEADWTPDLQAKVNAVKRSLERGEIIKRVPAKAKDVEAA